MSELYQYNEGVYQKNISKKLNWFSAAGVLWAFIELANFLYSGFAKTNDANIIRDMVVYLPENVRNFCVVHPRMVTLFICVLFFVIVGVWNKVCTLVRWSFGMFVKVWRFIKNYSKKLFGMIFEKTKKNP